MKIVKKKVGRPKKDPENALTVKLHVRLLSSEKMRAERQAHTMRVSMSEYIRALIRADTKQE